MFSLYRIRDMIVDWSLSNFYRQSRLKMELLSSTINYTCGYDFNSINDEL